MSKKCRNVFKAWLLIIAMVVSVAFPGVGTIKSKAATKMSVTYTVHIQTYGDSQGWVDEGKMAGTYGEAKRLEEIRIKLLGDEYSGNIRYKTHVQSFGWKDWSSNGDPNGSRGLGKRLEGIEIELTGEVAKHYDVVYRVYCQTYGWMPWVKNGLMAGTSGQAKRLEGIEIKLVPKTEVVAMGVQYRVHCQSFGWLPWSSNGDESGTTGLGKRLEAIEMKLSGNQYTGGIEYKTHIQSYGWENTFVSNGAMSGTSGQAKRLEAIQIQLYGEVADYYDVYYRVHAQTYGWLGWVKNGTMSGTSGLAKRLESIQVVLVPKGSDTSAYDNSGNGYVVKDPNTTPAGVSYTSNDEWMYRVIELVNIERRKVGAPDLKFDKGLTLSANVRAKELVTKFDHTRPDGTACYTAFPLNVGFPRGENIAGGQSSPEAVMNAWMNSSGHRKNILNPSFRTIGVGYYETTAGYRKYWVQNFGGPVN